jgi:ApaG protein
MAESNLSRGTPERSGYTFRQTTNGIEVAVTPVFIPEQSNPNENLYVWSYEIEIVNRSEEAVQLKSRYWRILSGHGQLIEVRGAGVVGDQPTIGPGSTYSYTSYTHLPTPSGMMIGTYKMQRGDNGETFDVDVPAFSLDSPTQIALPN